MPDPTPTVSNILSVDGTPLPKIREYHYTLEDIDGDNSTRTEAGVMHREVIRENVYHASVVHICAETEMETICGALKADATVEITALCPGKGDPTATFNAYVSKLEAQLILYENQAGNTESWWQVSYQLVEV